MPIEAEMPIPVEIRYGDTEITEVIPADGIILKVRKDEKLIVDPMKRILCDVAD
jgi:hypothetical protein